MCLLAEWTLKASGLFEADSMFLIEKDACAVVKDIAFQLEGDIRYASKCITDALVNVWEQTQFLSWHNQALSECCTSKQLRGLKGKSI